MTSLNCSPEVSLITAVILEPHRYGEVSSLLDADCFGIDDCRKTWTAMRELAERGEVPEILALHKHLAKSMSATEAGMLLDRMTDGAPIQADLKRYAVMVVGEHKKAKLGKLMESSLARASQGEDSGEIISDTLQSIWDIQETKSSNEIKSVKELTPQVLESIHLQREGDNEKLGIMTGLNEIDLATRGLCESEFWVCGAMPGRGKTAFATQVALNAAQAGKPVLFFSLEMTAEQLIRRVFGQEFGAGSLKNPRSMSHEKWKQVCEYAAENAEIPFFIEDSSSLSASDVAMKAKLAIRQRGISLIVVDYLQLLKGSGRELRERVGAAANALRQLAKDTGVPVLALSQLRRPQNINDIPSMIDLKESGDIEAHANTVLLLYMPIGDDKQPTGEEQIIIGKQRNGPIGGFPVYFDKKNLVFRDRSL